jgi:hypothetical protein
MQSNCKIQIWGQFYFLIYFRGNSLFRSQRANFPNNDLMELADEKISSRNDKRDL